MIDLTKTNPIDVLQNVPSIVQAVPASSIEELATFLMEIKGASFVTFLAETELPKMRKTGNPFVGATKLAVVNGTINFFYDKAVLRRLEAEGKGPEAFERGESWHVPEKRSDGTLTPFALHKKTGERYLRLMPGKTLSKAYVLNGEQVPTDEIERFIPAPFFPSNQGLDKPVQFRVWKLAGIHAMNTEGRSFRIGWANTSGAGAERLPSFFCGYAVSK